MNNKMNDKVKQKYKDLFITLIEEDDWAGARNLLDTIIERTEIAQTVNTPPVVEQVPTQAPPAPPPATDFDNERMAKFEAQAEARNKRT